MPQGCISDKRQRHAFLKGADPITSNSKSIPKLRSVFVETCFHHFVVLIDFQIGRVPAFIKDLQFRASEVASDCFVDDGSTNLSSAPPMHRTGVSMPARFSGGMASVGRTSWRPSGEYPSQALRRGDELIELVQLPIQPKSVRVVLPEHFRKRRIFDLLSSSIASAEPPHHREFRVGDAHRRAGRCKAQTCWGVS